MSVLDGRSEAGKLVSAFVDAVEAIASRIGGGRRYSVVEEPDGLAAWAASRRGAKRIGALDALDDKTLKRLGATRVDMRLDPEKLVAASLKLPAEAKGFAAPVIEHRLEKLTPWRPDKVAYGYSIDPAKGADGQHDVRFIATARETVAAALARAAAHGIRPVALGSAAEPVERPLTIDLLAGAAGPRGRRRMIAAAAIGVFVATSALFGWSQWLASGVAAEQAALDARIADTRRRLAENAGAGGERRGDLALIQRKTPERAAFMLIDRLARTLPDGTVLDELEIKPASVRIAGSSDDASALVGLLEADATLRDAEFGAPVTRQFDGRDRFDIVLTRAGMAAP